MGLAIILFVVIGPFYWRFQGFDTDGYSLAGVLSQSDAKGYFIGGLKILYGEQMPEFSARRPLFSAFLAVLFYILNQNFELSLLLLAIIVSFSIYLLGMEIRDDFGIFPAALVIMMMVYGYIGKFHGKFLTEQLGLPLGLISLTLLLRGFKEKNLFYFPLATFILTIALNVRAGAFFVLPLLMLWFIALKRGTNYSIFAFSSIIIFSVAIGFIVNLWLFKSVSAPGSVPFNNFGDTLYGMATGYRGWRAFHVDYPDLSSSEAMPISVRIILNDPSTFLNAVFRAYSVFFNPTRFFSFLYLPNKHMTPIAYIMTSLMIVGLYRLITIRHTVFGQMMFAVIVGIILSVPFAPPIDDGIRAMMVTAPFWALIVGLSFANLLNFNARSIEEWKFIFPKLNMTLLFSFMMVVSVTLGWLFVNGAFKPTLAENDCRSGEYPITLRTSQGSFINVVANKSLSLSWLPNIRKEDARKNAKNFSGIYSYDSLSRMDVGQSLLYGLNLVNEGNTEFVWLIMPTDSIKSFNGINYFCGVKIGRAQFDNANFYVDRTLINSFRGK